MLYWFADNEAHKAVKQNDFHTLLEKIARDQYNAIISDFTACFSRYEFFRVRAQIIVKNTT